MPKTEKKLKAVKSHYAYETRKDVDLAELKSLKLENAWPFIRSEIEKEIGNGELICVPFITEPDHYQICSAFVRDEEHRYAPLGKLASLLDDAESDAEYSAWLRTDSFEDRDYKFPHESVKITLQDEKADNKVRVIMLNFFRQKFPTDKSPVNKVCIKNVKELKGQKSIYVITNVLMAKTVEFRANTSNSSRIFHLGNPTPLVFAVERFDINKDGLLVSQAPAGSSTKKAMWNKIDPHDHLFGTASNTSYAITV